jgi:D-sedoheptulose 7-phosphate isomerase
MSCSGRSANILAAITAARDQRLAVLAMTGSDTSAIMPLLDAGDTLLPIAATEAAYIQEGHLVLLHALMSGLEASMERQPG